MASIRLAQASDLDAVWQLDVNAHNDQRRRDFIARAVQAGSCFVALDDQIIGYGVLEYIFYENGFVSMLYVQADRRRSGIGLKLMRHFESICRTPRLFTSTNLSNQPMQVLLAKLNYRLSGVLYHLDEDDPELVFFKVLQ
jgi:GNAT superfamily N-acetyltransferase